MTLCSSPQRTMPKPSRPLVNDMKSNGHDLVLQHTRVYRPWGWYEGLNRGDRYQVKCIMVKPGGKLSLQSHHHRSEHWVVVRGTLEVVKGEETNCSPKTNPPTFRLARNTGFQIRGRSLPFSLRCNRVPISPKTILLGLKIFTAEVATSSALRKGTSWTPCDVSVHDECSRSDLRGTQTHLPPTPQV